MNDEEEGRQEGERPGRVEHEQAGKSGKRFQMFYSHDCPILFSETQDSLKILYLAVS